MALTAQARRRAFERQLDRLRSPILERHELFNVATALLLLLPPIDSDAAGDVEGHTFAGHEPDPDESLVSIRRRLNWVQVHGSVADMDELRAQTRAAAEALIHHLQ